MKLEANLLSKLELGKVSFLPQNSEMGLKLYGLLLGGKHPEALLELHDLRMTLAKNQKEAFRNVAKTWFGDLETAHVDAWLDLSRVDGHALCNEDSGEPGKTLFFINIGSYRAGIFNEDHHYHFLIGKTLGEVKARAKKLVSEIYAEQKSGLAKANSISLPHVDNATTVEQVLAIREVQSNKIFWKADSTVRNSPAHTGYWPLRALSNRSTDSRP